MHTGINGSVCKPWFLEANMTIFAYRTVHYYAELGQCTVFSTSEAPEQFASQVTVLKYFAHYMEENLMDVSIYTWCLVQNQTLHAYLAFSFFISQCQCCSNSTGWWFAQCAWYQQAKALSPAVVEVRSCTHDALQWWHFSGTAYIHLALVWILLILSPSPDLFHKGFGDQLYIFQLCRWTSTMITPR